MRWLRLAAHVCAVAVALSGCSHEGNPSGFTPPVAGGTTPSGAMRAGAMRAAAFTPPSAGKIRHIVIVMQENRSFDDLFHGFPGANTAMVGVGSDATVYPLEPVSLASPYDLDHEHFQFLQDYANGTNTGFDREIKGVGENEHCDGPDCGPNHCPYPDPINHPTCWHYAKHGDGRAFAYVPQSETVPIWTLAQHFALGDNMFQSNNGPSFPSHLYMISGQSQHVSENPSLVEVGGVWGCDGASSEFTLLLQYGSASPPAFSPATGHEVIGGYPCFNYQTMAQLLDAAHVSWAYYAPAIGSNKGQIWSVFDAIDSIRHGPDWQRNVKSPETRVLGDVAHGDLAQVTWVVPSFKNSDHAGSRSTTGPQWVASVVNAIGKSRYWKDTAIVVMWDDWGGWYDHVVPPQYPDSQTGAYEGLGFRVPVIVVSPYARHGYVSHQQHEIASALHLIEDTFGLPSMGVADARADAFDDMFDFSQMPADFAGIPTTVTPAEFVDEAPSDEPPDND